ncbi:hypothetical protein, partial [Caballeronia sp. LZ033]|uniref:hypothetical protein n=1 Tax=Caballeronia sp. LZ033 TaxID=3038566 RepID=UPI00286BE5C9
GCIEDLGERRELIGASSDLAAYAHDVEKRVSMCGDRATRFLHIAQDRERITPRYGAQCADCAHVPDEVPLERMQGAPPRGEGGALGRRKPTGVESRVRRWFGWKTGMDCGVSDAHGFALLW